MCFSGGCKIATVCCAALAPHRFSVGLLKWNLGTGTTARNQCNSRQNTGVVNKDRAATFLHSRELTDVAKRATEDRRRPPNACLPHIPGPTHFLLAPPTFSPRQGRGGRAPQQLPSCPPHRPRHTHHSSPRSPHGTDLTFPFRCLKPSMAPQCLQRQGPATLPAIQRPFHAGPGWLLHALLQILPHMAPLLLTAQPAFPRAGYPLLLPVHWFRPGILTSPDQPLNSLDIARAFEKKKDSS